MMAITTQYGEQACSISYLYLIGSEATIALIIKVEDTLVLEACVILI